ncbi:L-arabinose 1-dehydrogenase (NAD(P)(+)) [uncultured archaeon]|nr:L-arabinose 1-dehydrogenase (NAD(P)(+)) [uncultured archaeon]
MKILVTGGAGFVGSHLTEHLLKLGHNVVAVDDLSLGTLENIRGFEKNPRFTFIKLNLLAKKRTEELFKKNKFDCVFHLAANSDIQKSRLYPSIDLKKTFMTTYNVLECMRSAGVEQIVFTSSSAIYGETDQRIHEDLGPLLPTSFYGAAKLSSEGFISAFCVNYGIKAWILRFPNVVGERATHGVVYDFVRKLKKNPKELEILGDGKQEKPYAYVKDIVEGIIYAWKHSNDDINIFNLGTQTTTTVTKIAQTLVTEMNLKNVKFKYTGGDRGWTGDVPKYQYDLTKIHKLGWKAKHNSDQAVRTAIKAILKNGR